MNRLAGKIALITGAAGGIGRAIGERFHAEGASVVLADIDGDRAAAASRAIDHDGERATATACDVSSATSAGAAVDTTIARFGRLDVLVNNAAAHTPNHTIDTLSVDDWNSTIAVNLSGAFLMSRAAITPMKAQGSGLIIHMASQLGHVGAPQRAAYAATKAALVSLARTMALDHGPDGIRVASLSPGAVLTERLEQRYGSMSAASGALAHRYATGRLSRPGEVAAAAAYLASDEASFITGSDLLIDGGYSAR
ncbi:MAG: SDR family NAD(P)-dependent oxidoreductase [Acidimicrobiales bacterium]